MIADYLYFARGVPKEVIYRANQLTLITGVDFPDADEATTLYESIYTGTFTDIPHFRQEPQKDLEELSVGRDMLLNGLLVVEQTFHQIFNGQYSLLADAILSFLSFTKNLTSKKYYLFFFLDL